MAVKSALQFAVAKFLIQIQNLIQILSDIYFGNYVIEINLVLFGTLDDVPC